MKRVLVVCLALSGVFSVKSAAGEVVFESRFDSPEFLAGPLAEGQMWRSISSGDAIIEVATATSRRLDDLGENQVLLLEQTTPKIVPTVRAIFKPLSEAVSGPFRASFTLGGTTHAGNPGFEVLICDSTTAAKGMLVGLAVTKDSGGALRPYALNGTERSYLHAPGDGAPPVLEIGKLYDFVIMVDSSGLHYSIEVSLDGRLVAEGRDFAVRGDLARYNAVIARIATGSPGDELFLDQFTFSLD